MKTFHITSTIDIEAESRDDVIAQLVNDRRNENDQSQIAYDLLANAEIDEANDDEAKEVVDRCVESGCTENGHKCIPF